MIRIFIKIIESMINRNLKFKIQVKMKIINKNHSLLKNKKNIILKKVKLNIIKLIKSQLLSKMMINLIILKKKINNL